MRRIDKPASRTRHPVIVVAALIFAGCSALPPEPGPLPEPEIVEPAPEIVGEPAQPSRLPTPSPRVPDEPPTPAVAILLTGSQPSYAEVAAELAKRLSRYDVYDFSDDSGTPVNILRLVNDSDAGIVVAIGLRAARSSVAMSRKPVVFSQVFNHQDHNLLTDNSRGVAAFAPLDAQLAAWRQLDPSVSQIGVIIGEGHDDLIAAAELAAERLGIDLRIHVSRSDQETLYFFKRMVRDIDGFWLFPDNRILSRRALQQIMDDARRQQVPVLAPSESMLSIGASLSITTVASDIADTITRIVRRIEAGDLAQIPPITGLSEIRVRPAAGVRLVDR